MVHNTLVMNLGFCALHWNFNHRTSSPRYPQSNGLAERTVQTAKRLLTKSKKDGHNLFMSLLAYRSTPLSIGLSPSQLLMSRRLRSNLPMHPYLLKPHVHDHFDVKHSMMSDKVKLKQNYDKRSKLSPPLDKGDNVRVQLNSRTWTPATILQPRNDRSYLVKMHNGSVYRRNSRQILRSREKAECDIETPNLSVIAPQPIAEPEPKPKTFDSDIVQSMSTNTLSDQPINFVSPKPVQNDKPYVTRSGRIVKPKQILNL